MEHTEILVSELVWSVLPLTCTELRLFSAAQFLFLIVDVEIPGELFVILHPVARLLALPAVPGVALHSAVDDVDGGAEPGRQTTSPVLSYSNCLSHSFIRL